MKLSTILTSLLLLAATFLPFGASPARGLFADEQPARTEATCLEQLQAAGPTDLRAPGKHELDQPLGRLGLGLAGALGGLGITSGSRHSRSQSTL